MSDIPVSDVHIALVGIGGYGRYYVDELLRASATRQVKLVAGIDAFPERSGVLDDFRKANIPIYADLESFYCHSTADLVIIAAPIHLHAPLTCLALARGSNVLCEKPLCALLSEADQMAEAERQAEKFVAIGYQWSFTDAIQALKQDVMAGVFGLPKRLKTLVLWPRFKSYYRRNDWAGRIKISDSQWVLDSPVNNATAHYLHNMLYLLGETSQASAKPASVQAELYRANPIENYDTAALRVVTQPGIEMLMFTAHPVSVEIGPWASYEFELATIEYGDDRVFTARFRDGRVKVYGNPEDTQANKLWQSVAAVQSREPVACGIEAARAHTVCVNEIQKIGIDDFPRHRVQIQRQEADELVWVNGLADCFLRCYHAGYLPSESGEILW